MNLWNKLLSYKNLLVAAAISFLLILFGRTKKKEGELEVENKILKDKEEKLNEGRKETAREKRAVDGLSDGDLVNRLRRRGDDWGRL
jgi:hypothetical protein